LTISNSSYGSVFFIPTGFHGLHVLGGLVAFLFVLLRSFSARRFSERDATFALVVSYYWHFVDAVWIVLFSTIYLLPFVQLSALERPLPTPLSQGFFE